MKEEGEAEVAAPPDDRGAASADPVDAPPGVPSAVGASGVVPGLEANPIDLDGEAPLYTPGDVPGAVVDLTVGEEDPVCFVCLHETLDGRFCDRLQRCCQRWCHSACIEPWRALQQARFQEGVGCPHCRRVDLA